MRLFPFAFVALIAATPAASQGLTAGALQGMCSNATQAATCAAYIQGYIEGRNQALQRDTICPPKGATIGTIAGGFIQHLTNNRLEANIQAGLVLGNHLVTTYPCR